MHGDLSRNPLDTTSAQDLSRDLARASLSSRAAAPQVLPQLTRIGTGWLPLYLYPLVSVYQ